MPMVQFNQSWFSELNQCKCKPTFEQPHLFTGHVMESAHLSSYYFKLRRILRCDSVCIYPRCRAAIASINLEPEWFFTADVLWLVKFPLLLLLKAISPSIWSYLSAARWGQPQQDLKVFACQSFSLCTMFGRSWHGTPAPELIFKVSLFMKSILRFGKVHSAVTSLTGLSSLNLIQAVVSLYQHPVSQHSKIRRLPQRWATHLFLLTVYVFVALSSPHDLANLPSSSCSNHALKVQRDAFFILTYEKLKRLYNVCSAMQT